MKNTQQPSAITFPCEFPIKVFGQTSMDFEASVITILHKHVPDLPEGAIQLRGSKQGNYTSMTIKVPADSQEQLDAIYRELTASTEVLMVL